MSHSSSSLTTLDAPAPARAQAPAPASSVFGRLGVLPWLDPSIDDRGFDPRSTYVESFWLPLLGPSTTLLLRRLAEAFDEAPEGFELDCAVASREIGLGSRMTKRAPFVRTLDRSIKFGMAQLNGDVLHVRRRMPPLSSRQVAKLSPRLRNLHREHHEHSGAGGAGGDGDGDADATAASRRAEVVRATHLARTLRALGESELDIERQLQAWCFAPGIAWHAVQLVDRGDVVTIVEH